VIVNNKNITKNRIRIRTISKSLKKLNRSKVKMKKRKMQRNKVFMKICITVTRKQHMKEQSFKSIVAVVMKKKNFLKMISIQSMFLQKKKYLMVSKSKNMPNPYKSQTLTMREKLPKHMIRR